MTFFSVLIPVYIKEDPKFLAASLDSILVNQTIKPTEIVVVEDGPLTKELSDLLAEYCVRFKGIIKVFRLEKNMGMGYAMNYGLNQCQNEWIFRMDSDDIAVATRFEKQLEFIDSAKYDVIGSSIQEFNFVVGDLLQFRVMPEKHIDIISFMKTRNPINHMTVAFRKSKAVDAGGYWDKRYFEDYNLWYEMSKVGSRFYNIQEPLVYARIGNDMVSRRSGYAYYKYEMELMKKFLREKFINIFEYRSILSVKFVLRILPVPMLTWLYTHLLRKKS